MLTPRPKQNVPKAQANRTRRVVPRGVARGVAPGACISSVLSASVHQFLHLLLLGDDLFLSAAVAALTLCQAGAPVVAPSGADAVLADLVAIAVAQATTCRPVTGGPLTPIALIVKAITSAGSFAKRITRRATGLSTMRTAAGRAAVARAARQCWIHANGEGCDPGGTADERRPNRLPPSNVSSGSFSEFADLAVEPCAK